MTDRFKAEDLKKPTSKALEIVEVSDVLNKLLIGHIPAAGDENWLATVLKHYDRAQARGICIGLGRQILRISCPKAILFSESLPPSLGIILNKPFFVAENKV